MIPAAEFIVVEFDSCARKIKKISLKEFNERRRDEFKIGSVNPTMVLLGVFETNVEADKCISEHEDVDGIISAITKGQDPFQ